MRSISYRFSTTLRKRGTWHNGRNVLNFNFRFVAHRVYFFSSQPAKVKQQPPVDDESEAFYVVRKGDIIGIYKSLSECQAQVSSVCDPSVIVCKGHILCKETEEYLASRVCKMPYASLMQLMQQRSCLET